VALVSILARLDAALDAQMRRDAGCRNEVTPGPPQAQALELVGLILAPQPALHVLHGVGDDDSWQLESYRRGCSEVRCHWPDGHYTDGIERHTSQPAT
jgi:hypothetical protein